MLLNALIAIMSDAATAAADTGLGFTALPYPLTMCHQSNGASPSPSYPAYMCVCTDGTKFLASKADIIDELEQSIPKWHRSADWYVSSVA